MIIFEIHNWMYQIKPVLWYIKNGGAEELIIHGHTVTLYGDRDLSQNWLR